jgi:hypothetical protein
MNSPGNEARRMKGVGNMIAMRIAFAAMLVGAGVATGTPVAQANPHTPMSVIDASAAELCAAVAADPTADGVMTGMATMDGGGLDDVDAAMVLISAVHHVCPQYGDLVMGTMEPVAADELCPKSWA